MRSIGDEEFYTASEVRHIVRNARRFELSEAEVLEDLPKYVREYGRLAWTE